ATDRSADRGARAGHRGSLHGDLPHRPDRRTTDLRGHRGAPGLPPRMLSPGGRGSRRVAATKTARLEPRPPKIRPARLAPALGSRGGGGGGGGGPGRAGGGWPGGGRLGGRRTEGPPTA